MLKLGTVFSGIGAIEHSLERLGIEYEVAFACDNGGIDIFSKKIERNLLAIDKEITELQIRLASLSDENYEDANALNIQEHFEHIQTLRKEIESISVKIGEELTEDQLLTSKMNSFFLWASKMDGKLKSSSLIENFQGKQLEEISKSHYYYLLRDIKDFYKNVKDEELLNNILDIPQKQYEIHFKVFVERSIVKELNSNLSEIIDTINMLLERLSTVEIIDDLSKINDGTQKKEYVDNLYKAKKKSNFVLQSYLANYDVDEEHFHWNASFLDGNQYKDQIDLFVGGSPCQSFSMVGKRRGLQDTRGTLFYEYARLIEEIQPKVFIYENVKGLINHDGGNTWATMQQVFDDLNYNWEYQVLNSKNYGIPQNRERLFVVGFRKDIKLSNEFSFPKPLPLEKTMQDFLLDSVSGKYYLNKKGVEFVTKEKNITKRYTQIDGEIQLCQKANQQFNWHGDFVFVEENKDKEKMMEDLEKYFLSEKVEKYVMSSGTKNFYSKPKIDLEIARPLLTTMHKMHRAGVDNYVTTQGRIRKLTPRECLRLMGFCDSFKIVVSDTQMYQQAGNSIVVDVLMELMKSIINSLPEILESRDYEYKNNLEQLTLL
ncbi:DNA (cytosine-5-)-methyltransferase [Bacillus thuringiensis]|uniref:DNA cytosine methyltransferase n=1 Tax=Bacillus thuringiensis TaxID=1428 RepID=UPI0007C19226|nr:DNA (cytosine-5-)-methyltransferase [Bacillus thuringiensis]AND10783.1 methyltransferase [Bacillus thuringiensis serovar alesti]MEC3594171.1 DNA (cytosine-5-)-methyltransferase [Bacillus thuringiensis]MED1834870.1 DNA (cytosine-5-)-methyltransferase [Bacillus thuringiensis]MED2207021.1 DNA (cytosine-5-)-methyltransferase [Bacillus thuringiensis]MED2669634.1 DNA (cytosine-5-)-methyltransferase [Bacillus thuringiensis]